MSHVSNNLRYPLQRPYLPFLPPFLLLVDQGVVEETISEIVLCTRVWGGGGMSWRGVSTCLLRAPLPLSQQLNPAVCTPNHRAVQGSDRVLCDLILLASKRDPTLIPWFMCHWREYLQITWYLRSSDVYCFPKYLLSSPSPLNIWYQHCIVKHQALFS